MKLTTVTIAAILQFNGSFVVAQNSTQTGPLPTASNGPIRIEEAPNQEHDNLAAPTTAPPSAVQPSLKLRPPSTAGTDDAATPATSRRNSHITTVIGSTAIVIGAFLLFVWATRNKGSRGSAPLPTEVIETLGRIPFAGRQQLQLIRLGNKLILVCISQGSVETLTEVTDPNEVERLCGLCHQTQPHSVTSSFRQVLSQYAEEPVEGGFLGDPRRSDVELANQNSRRQRREVRHA